MPELIELNDQDRQLAKRMWQALDGRLSLEQCEDAVKIVKECRHHGINPASIVGPGMESFLRLEQEVSADDDADNAGSP